MNVEILYFEGCPNHAIALEMVRRVLDREKVEANVRSIEVPDEKAAESERFLGSPSVRVNGLDIEPGREGDSPFFGCRTYTVAGKTVGVPPEKWLVDALRRGVEQGQLYANRTMMLLYKIGENEIEKAATPVGLKQLVEIFKSADVYVAY